MICLFKTWMNSQTKRELKEQLVFPLIHPINLYIYFSNAVMKKKRDCWQALLVLHGVLEYGWIVYIYKRRNT